MARRTARLFVVSLLAFLGSGCSYGGIAAAVVVVASSSGGSGEPAGDSIGPDIQILTPARGTMLTGAQRVRVTGAVSDPSGVTALEVNGESVTPDSAGTFSVVVPLRYGVNKFSASATDTAGNQSHVEWAYLWSSTYLPVEAPIKNAVAARIARKALSAIPSSLYEALAGKGVVRTDPYADLSFTLALHPTQVVQGLDAVTTFADGFVVSAVGQPSGVQPPGIPSRTASTSPAPDFKTSRDLSIAIREDLINQALYSAFARGNWNIRIDEAFLKSHGIQLPFELNAHLLVPFIPALAGMIPPNDPAPLAIDLEATMPPVLDGKGQRPHIQASLGEYHVTLSAFIAQKVVRLLSFATHFETEASLVDNGNCSAAVRVSAPRHLSASVLENPLGVAQLDLDRIVQPMAHVSLPLLVEGLPTFPVPLIDCFTLRNLRLQQPHSGTGDFLTIHGELIR